MLSNLCIFIEETLIFLLNKRVSCYFFNSSPGWWLVENEDKRLAWFPAPYLELSEGDDDDDEDELQLRGVYLCCAGKFDFKECTGYTFTT